MGSTPGVGMESGVRGRVRGIWTMVVKHYEEEIRISYTAKNLVSAMHSEEYWDFLLRPNRIWGPQLHKKR